MPNELNPKSTLDIPYYNRFQEKNKSYLVNIYSQNYDFVEVRYKIGKKRAG
jgi:hypothetical protein